MRIRTFVSGALLMFLLSPSGVRAVGVDLVFLGVLGNDAPAIEKAFDTRIREALSVNPEYHVLDYLASQDFRHRINFDDFPTVSKRLVEGLRQFTSDSTVFVWVTVKSRTIKPVRKWLVKAAAHGEIILTLNMYSLRYREYAFIGDVCGSAEKPEGFIFFYPLETGVHISATDYVEITDNLVNAAAFRSADLITSVVRSEKARVIFGSDSGGMSKYKAASISDMFNVPSVEGANVERGRKKTAPANAPKFAPTPVPTPAPTPASAAAPASATAPAANADKTVKPAMPAASPEKGTETEKKAVKADSTAAK
jgi:hypothetical protein